LLGPSVDYIIREGIRPTMVEAKIDLNIFLLYRSSGSRAGVQVLGCSPDLGAADRDPFSNVEPTGWVTIQGGGGGAGVAPLPVKLG
jgi:hypothetical protein